MKTALLGVSICATLAAAATAGITPAEERDIALWIIRLGGQVMIDDVEAPIADPFDLPNRDFRIVVVDMHGTITEPKDLEPLSKLQHVRELYIPAPSGPDPISFENVASRAGVEFILWNAISTRSRRWSRALRSSIANNDGRTDLYFVNGAAQPRLEKIDPSNYNRLYHLALSHRNDPSPDNATLFDTAVAQEFSYCPSLGELSIM